MADQNAILRAIKARLLPPEAHTKGTAARDATSFPVAPTDPAAVCWCLLGAARVETEIPGSGRVERYELRTVIHERLCDAAAELWPARAAILPCINDVGVKTETGTISGYDAVHLLLDRAIENCPP